MKSILKSATQKACLLNAILIITLSLCFVSFAQAGGYTYDGIINPKDLQDETQWKCEGAGVESKMLILSCDNRGMNVLVWLAKNPRNEFFIARYTYVVNGKIHVYSHNGKGHYSQVAPQLKKNAVTKQGKNSKKRI